MANVDVSIILACYNEGPTFKKSVKRIVAQIQKIKAQWEIIFVDDKSTDETKKIIERMLAEINNCKAIYHLQNHGRGKSVSDGIRSAKGKICGYLDVDCEVSPAYIPLFLKELDKGFDMVIGRRFYESGPKSLTRFIASKLYAFIVKLALALPFEDTEVGFKFFKRSQILPICAKVKNKRWFWDTEICARAWWAGLKVGQLPVLFVRRQDKKSTVRLFADSLGYITSLIKLRPQRPSIYR